MKSKAQVLGEIFARLLPTSIYLYLSWNATNNHYLSILITMFLLNIDNISRNSKEDK